MKKKMNTEEKKKRVLFLVEEYAKKGIVIDIKEPLDKICSNKQDMAWYDGLLATITYNDKYEVKIFAEGSFRGYLEILEDEAGEKIYFQNPEEFEENCSKYIENDKVLYRIIDEKNKQKRIIFYDKNWIEFDIKNLKNDEYWECCNLETVIDGCNVFDAIMDIEGYQIFIEENKELYEGIAS